MIRRLFRFLGDTEGTLWQRVLRSSFWVTVAGVGVNTLVFARSIFLARLLTPEVFGLMGICLMVIRGVQLFTETGFGAALIHRQTGFEEARDTAFVLMVGRGLLLSLIVVALAIPVADFYGEPVLQYCLPVIAASLVFLGFQNINLVARQKELDYRSIYFLNQTKAILDFVVVVGLAWYLRSVWALVYGHVVVSVLHTLASYLIIPGRPSFRFDKSIARELFGYGKFITGLTVVVFVTTEIDNVVIGKVMGTEALGIYVLAYMLANLPATHVAKLISQVMFPAYSKLQSDLPRLRGAYIEVLELVSRVTVPAAAGLIVLAPQILGAVYGDKWLPGAQALQILAVFGALRAIGGVGGYVYNAIGKPNITFYLVTAKLVIIGALIYPLTVRYGIEGAAVAVTGPIAFEVVAAFAIFSRVIDLPFRRIIAAVIPAIGHSAVMAAAVHFGATALGPIGLGELLLLVAGGMVLYALLNARYLGRLYVMIRGTRGAAQGT